MSSLSVWETADLIPAVVQIVCTAIFFAITAPLRGPRTPRSFKTHVTLSVARTAFSRLTTRQRQALTGTTRSRYQSWVMKNRLQPEITILKDGKTAVFWIGQPSAEYVVLFLHGGGWSMAAGSGHFQFAASVVELAAKRGKILSFAFVQYDLAPQAQYPSQIGQCAGVLDYVLTTLAKEPSNIILAGDSSGGNLVMSVLSHLLHPHPDLPTIQLLSPLKAVVVFSPWVRFDMERHAIARNQLQDPVSPKVMQAWGRDYLGTSPADNYNQPGIAPTNWWRGLPVEQLLVTGATHEMIVDDLMEFSEKMRTIHQNTRIFFAPNDIHAQPVIGPEMGLKEGEQGDVIRQWIVMQIT